MVEQRLRDARVSVQRTADCFCYQAGISGYHGAGDTLPFGGMKASGVGREKGLAALANHCGIKAVTITP